MDVYNRYRLEPRGKYGRSSRSYLIAFDKETKTYVTETNNPKKYMHFTDSDTAFAFLHIKDHTDTRETSQT